MVSERMQRRIDRLLDEAEEAADQEQWSRVADLAQRVLAIDDTNADAPALIRMADGGALLAKASEVASGAPVRQPQAVPVAQSFDEAVELFEVGA